MKAAGRIGQFFLRVNALLLIGMCLLVVPVLAGPYRDSAHSNSVYGADRSALDGKYAEFATGNCAHCHESHASVAGGEPAPVTGPNAHLLFAPAFNAARTVNPYVETDNFCFLCHGEGTGPLVINQDYSTIFGGGAAGTGPQSIMAAFNQASYHNLYDIDTFLTNSPTYSAWYTTIGNPCSACHDSHLAKRNWDSGQTGFPLLSAISKPATEVLWGETEVMSAYFGYEAPYALDSTNREPAGVGLADGSNTPDYVGFCTTCHNADNLIYSTTLARNLKQLDWGDLGTNRDKHGPIARDGSDHFREPYVTAAATQTNFFMSCLDCHEPHGSANVMLLRSRVNGEDLEGMVASTDTMSYACKRCHTDDLAANAGTLQADSWEYVHHLVSDAPYPKTSCNACHGSGGGGTPIGCGNCHGHGMDDSWVNSGTLRTNRKTF